MNRVCRRLGPLAVSACCLAALACVGQRYEPLPQTGASLEGTVTYGKDQVAAALIIVTGDKASASGKVGGDGRYKVDNVPLGTVTVGVNTDAGKGEAFGRAVGMAQASHKKATPPKIVDVPKKYQDPTKSGITTTVSKGVNTFDIVIPK